MPASLGRQQTLGRGQVESSLTSTPKMNQSADLVDIGNTTTADNATLALDPEENVELGRIKEILFTVQYVLLPFFFVTGLFGNTMTIITVATRHFQNMTSRYILIFLALSDTILLITYPFNKLFIMEFIGRDLRALSDVGCKVFFVVFKSAKMTSSWLVVLLCFERFIAVVFPLKAKLILRKRFILPAIALDYAVILTYNSVWTFSSQIVNNVCKPDVPSLRQKVFVSIGTCLYSFIPTTLLLILTPMIVAKLFRQRNFHRRLSSKKSTRSSKSDEEMLKASLMVVGVMIAYILLIIPISVVHIYSFTAEISAFDVNSTGFFIFREIAQILEQVNYAINFFLYVMCSSVFRKRVFNILKCAPSTDSRSRMLARASSSKDASSKQLSSGSTIISSSSQRDVKQERY